MNTARQARAVVNGMSDTGAIGQQATARSEYNAIRKTLADRKAAVDTNAAAAAVTASSDRVKAYGQAYDKYQAGVAGAGTDDEFKAAKEVPSTLWKNMNLSEKTQATSDIIAKSRALDKVAAPNPTVEEKEEEKKKSKLPSARSIFGR